VPEFDGGGGAPEARCPVDGGGGSEPRLRAAEEGEDDFDADSEPEDAQHSMGQCGGGWVHQDKDSESRVIRAQFKTS
jgi:hypothetical protein